MSTYAEAFRTCYACAAWLLVSEYSDDKAHSTPNEVPVFCNDRLKCQKAKREWWARNQPHKCPLTWLAEFGVAA